MVTTLRRIWRIARLVPHILVGVFQSAVMFGYYSPTRRDRVISNWSAKLLRILNVHLVCQPLPSLPKGALLVANHISWVDIFVILAVRRVHFVSKHEVRTWPVMGWLAWRAGTLFLHRAKKADTLRIADEMHQLLHEGAWVAVFPEGTSTDGRQLLRFMPSLFQPAIAERLPVVTAALRYRTLDGEFTDAAAYADNTSFGQSLMRISGTPGIAAHLDFGNVVQGEDRRALAQSSHAEIARLLGFELPDNLPAQPDDLPDTAR